MPSPEHDIWASGDAYEPYVGRWSRLVGREFLDWIAVPPGARWLDLGCGTGALSQTILLHGAPATLIGIEPSAGFLATARLRTTDRRAKFCRADAQAIPLPDNAADATVSGLVLNFIPDKDLALREMVRVTRPGGLVAVYVWDYAGEMQLIRRFWEAAAALDPAARLLDEGIRFPICAPQPLATLFARAGLDRVDTRAIDVPTVFRDYDDLWRPFLGGQGPAPGYCASLDEEQRARLREALRAALPIEADGTIRLIARAFAARGIKPAPA